MLLLLTTAMFISVSSWINHVEAKNKKTTTGMKNGCIVLRVGDKAKVTIDKDSKVKLSKQGIVNVNSKGRIIGVKKGKCTVTVRFKKKHVKYVVTVKKKTDSNATKHVPTGTSMPSSVTPTVPVIDSKPTMVPTPTSTPWKYGTDITLRGLIVEKIVENENPNYVNLYTTYLEKYQNQYPGVYVEGVKNGTVKYLCILANKSRVERERVKVGDTIECNIDVHIADDVIIKGDVCYTMMENYTYHGKYIEEDITQ